MRLTQMESDPGSGEWLLRLIVERESEAVAGIINSDPFVGHVVIEGHASQEGDYQHNYTLAESRSRRIWEYFATSSMPTVGPISSTAPPTRTASRGRPPGPRIASSSAKPVEMTRRVGARRPCPDRRLG